MATWKGNTMSIAGRVVLINSSLFSTFIYHMSLYLLPKTVINELDKQRKNFIWQGGGQKRKYHLVKWEVICKSKKKGGLGIKDISEMKKSLLCKWWWKLDKEDGVWQDIIKEKYLRNDTISSVTFKLGDSPVWRDLLKVKCLYLKGRQVKVKNGLFV